VILLAFRRAVGGFLAASARLGFVCIALFLLAACAHGHFGVAKGGAFDLGHDWGAAVVELNFHSPG
jgi:hypothetical protein